MTGARILVLATLFGALGCKPAPEGPDLGRLRAFTVKNGGERALFELDVSGNGRLDAADWHLFDQVARAAHQLLQSRGLFVGVRHKLYAGPPKGQPEIFSFVAVHGGTLDLSRVPVARLEELQVEAHWAAQQARFASLVKDGLEQPVHGMLRQFFGAYNPNEMLPRSVCDGLASFDVSPYQKLGLPLVAIFDLDSTVWAGNITDVFLALLAERQLPKAETNPNLQKFLATVPGIDQATVAKNSVSQNAALMLERHTNHDLPKGQRVSAKDAFYNIVGVLAGLTPDEVRPVARAAFFSGSKSLPPWRSRVFVDPAGCGMREIINALAGKGVEIYFLSATLDILAEEGGALFGIPPERVLGSILEVVAGRYTGKVADSTYYTKGAIVRQWLPAPPMFAFGDSPTSDLAMLLEAAGVAFVVNPRPPWQQLDEQKADSRLVFLRYPKDAPKVEVKK